MRELPSPGPSNPSPSGEIIPARLVIVTLAFIVALSVAVALLR